MLSTAIRMKLVVLVVIISAVSALDNGLSRTPPMGWMSWQRYRCITDCKKYPEECISENLVKNMADLMVSEGYLDAGYDYVNIDDCWSEFERDSNGRLVENKERFPSGMKALADYVHAKGLKFGLYNDIGTYTCAGYPGMEDHLEIDAQTFADWDVDFLKIDGCYADEVHMVNDYIKFGEYMNKTGRPMAYSCSWPAYQEEANIIPDSEILKKTCNLWRNYDDIEDSHASVETITKWFSDNQARIQPHSAPGHWNDPDTLILGNYGLSYDQSKSQMAVWTVMAAPLLISNDLKRVTPEVKEILLNKDIIAVNQDPLGVMGLLLKTVNRIEIWTRPILPIIQGELAQAVAFVSRRADGAPYSITVDLIKDVLLNQSNNPNITSYDVHDLFVVNSKPATVSLAEKFETRVNPSGANFYKFVPKI